MKVALLFLTIGCGMLLSSRTHATDDAKPRQKMLQTASSTNHREAAAKPGHGSVPLPKAVTSHRGTNSPKKNSTVSKTINADHHASDQRSNSINADSRGNRKSNQRRVVQPSLAPRTTAAKPSITRHRGPNPAIIGGPKNIATANTAALSGSTLRHGRGGMAP